MVEPSADDAQDDGGYEPIPDVVGVFSILPGPPGGIQGTQHDAGDDQEAIPVDAEVRGNVDEDRVNQWFHIFLLLRQVCGRLYHKRAGYPI